MLKSLITKIIKFGLLLSFLISVYYFHRVALQQEARLTVDALGQYIQAYKIIEGKSINSLRELPPFQIISPSYSFFLNSDNIKNGMWKGYKFDLQVLKSNRFVVSASPFGQFPGKQEFAITERGILKYNTENVDTEADSYEEVAAWNELPRMEHLRTKERKEKF